MGSFTLSELYINHHYPFVYHVAFTFSIIDKYFIQSVTIHILFIKFSIYYLFRQWQQHEIMSGFGYSSITIGVLLGVVKSKRAESIDCLAVLYLLFSDVKRALAVIQAMAISTCCH